MGKFEPTYQLGKEYYTLAGLALKSGKPKEVLKERLLKGWTVQKAVTTKLIKKEDQRNQQVKIYVPQEGGPDKLFKLQMTKRELKKFITRNDLNSLKFNRDT